MDLIMWYIVGMVLLVLIVVGLYIFDKSKISTHKKHLVYGILGLPFICLLTYIFLVALIEEGAFYPWALICIVVGFVFCIWGIYSGIKGE